MNKKNREYDRIAGNRISKTGGFDMHVSLSNKKSIILRNKFSRLGLRGKHINSILKLADELGFQEIMENQPLGVRFSTVKQKNYKRKIWKAK